MCWDGNRLSLYRPTQFKDYMVLHDGLLSVQEVRDKCITSGAEPIILYSCKPGMPSYEISYPGGECNGLFTRSMTNVTEQYPHIKLSKLVTKTNAEMKKSGLNQTCEIVCRLDMLHREYLSNLKTEIITFIVLDMCRTPDDSDSSHKNALKTKTFEDLTKIIKEHNKDVQIVEYRIKDIHFIVGIVLTVIDSGFFSMLLSILNLWSKKHYNASIKIAYQSTEDKSIEITYSKLNEKEVEEILSKNQPQIGSNIKIELPPFSS